ncbi:MAG TPA: bifunctional diguanylate cyclase/phosphodiesterase [Pilimelia sp.]|nr:bifunctional diguanylate cyclase/phosphodiesterase [Pilimelia sp.]
MHLPSGVELATLAATLLAIPGVAVLVRSARRRTGAARHAQQTLAAGAVLVAACAAAVVVASFPAAAPGSSAGRMTLATGISAANGVGMLALFTGLLRLPGVAPTLHAVMRHVLDCLIIAAALWFVGWVSVSAAPSALTVHLPRACVPVLLPAAGLALAVGLAIIAVLRCARPRTGVVAVAAGVCLVALAGVALTGGLCQGSAQWIGAGALAVPVGLATVAAGALRADRPADCDTDVLRNGTAFAFLPMLAMSVAAIFHWVAGGRSYDQHAVFAGVVEGFAMAARQYLALRDVRRFAGQLQESEAHFRELAHTDPLTGLANRRGLLATLRSQAVGGPPCVLLGMDLDGFKNINDMRGHDVGDQVLIEVGQRLRDNLRPGDVAARLGGDEFAVLMWARPPEAQRVAERLLSVLSHPYEQPQGTVFMSASIGLAGCATANDVPTLLRNADLALRYAKQRGKARVEQYDMAYDQELRRRTVLEHELRGAVDRGELHLAYQPVVAVPSVRPVGAEALLRWHHPTLGQVSPLEFIPIAEESGSITRLGAWVLHQACHQLSRWLADGHDVWVSVNVSPRELHSPEYVMQVADALEAHRVPPQRLVLEVTEHAVATDLDELVRRLRALRMTGVRIALDDFGAGYSSLGQLRNLPVDILKIDQGLVAEPQSQRTGTAAPLVDVVVHLGHRLGLEVIAEGIAEQSQLAAVEAAGCRWGQGWLLGRAVPAEHLEARLAAISSPAAPRPPMIGRPPAPRSPGHPGRSRI